MSEVIIVGSGPSGVHLAKTLVDLGRQVTMLDVGRPRPEATLPDADFDGLKERLEDPASYFLGTDGAGIVFPQDRPRYFTHPPSKEYVFSTPNGFQVSTVNFDPLISFAAGGLAEAWTGGSYPLNAAELSNFPIDLETLEPHYAEVVRRIGITAEQDDLDGFNTWFDGYSRPLEPDPHTALLLKRYASKSTKLNNKLGFYLGRSRVAVLGRDRESRRGCDSLGRCLWGCPRLSLYAPSSTLAELRKHPSFRYIDRMFVTHFDYEGDTVAGITATDTDGKSRHFTAELYALAAGTLCSSKILLDSIYRQTGQTHELKGLMDNSQAIAPFVTLGRLGKPVDTHSYQFHQLALGISRDSPEDYVHGQITTLKAASIHPIVQNIPLSLRAGLDVFRIAHAALGAANVWLPDSRRDENVLTIRPCAEGNVTDLVLRCVEDPADRFDPVLKVLKRALRRLGCFTPPGMTQRLPRGSSVHYAGTLPMQQSRAPFTCSPDCRSNDFKNLFFADGASFPSLPAKNLTFTLMANAIRVGRAMNGDFENELR